MMSENHFVSPFLQMNGHLQTIIPSLFRKVEVAYTRERLELSDGDFLDLDWVKRGSKKLIIVSHGLEGDSQRHYVTGLIKIFTEKGCDGLAWNNRGCSGEPNRLPRFYHHGDASDLKTVLNYADSLGYAQIFLAGYSMGGSLALRLMIENEDRLPETLIGAMAVSVPLDLRGCVDELCKPAKRLYMDRFIGKLYKKLKLKSKMHPGHSVLSVADYKSVKDFYDFDTRYTAPLHGYRDAVDFYEKATVKPELDKVKTPVLIVQAQNDPFLSGTCFDLGVHNPYLHLRITPNGGHVGFMEKNQAHSKTEKWAWEFFENLV